MFLDFYEKYNIFGFCSLLTILGDKYNIQKA